MLTKSRFSPVAYGFAEFSNPISKINEELDLVAIDSGGRHIFGECKWRDGKTGADVLSDLSRKASLLGYLDSPLYVLSKSGFTSDALKKAENDSRFHLITGEELIRLKVQE